MKLETVYLVVSAKSGAVLSAYTTRAAADADVAEVTDNRIVEQWWVKDGYTIGRYRP